MDSTKLFYFYLCDVWREFMLLVEQNFQEFGEAVVYWAYAMTNQKMPGDWRDRLADFLADWTDEHGTIVEDESLPVLFDWVAALGRQRGALPKDPNVVYPEDAWMKCFYRVPAAPTPSSGASGQVVDGVLTVRAKDIGDLTWRDLLLSLAAYRLPSDIRALMILVQGRDPRPFCTIYLSAELLRAFVHLPLADRQSIMSAAGSVSVEAAQASITRAVAAKTRAQNPQQPSPAQSKPPAPKLAPSPELPYNQNRSPDTSQIAAPASPQPIALAAAGAEKKQPAGKSETNAADPGGEGIKILRKSIPGAYPAHGTTIDTYIANPASLQELQAKYGNNIQLLDLTGEEAKYAAMVAGDKKAEASLAEIFNAIKKTSAFPPLPVLGYFWPETFGGHCIRWMGNFQSNTKDLLKSGLFTLDVPLAGGPNHQIMIYKLPGGLMGVDNGFFGQMDGGNNEHLFDPSSIADNTTLPAITRCQVKAAVDKMNGGGGSPWCYGD